MMQRGVFCGLIALGGLLGGCSEREQESEPSYDEMVLLDAEEEEWMRDEGLDRKRVVGEWPEPQELLIDYHSLQEIPSDP